MTQDIGQSLSELADETSPSSAQAANEAISIESLSDPFADSNQAFFSGADRRLLLDEVIHLCQFGNNLVTVMGEAGVGKTTLLTQARYELAETAFCCFLSAGALINVDDVFVQIIAQLELPVASSASVGEMVATLRHAMAEGNLHRVVIIIDDAHQLSDQILSALISLLHDHQTHHHLHLLIAGNASIVDRLDALDMGDVLAYDIHLSPFVLTEVKEYLEFKLDSAGYQSDGLISHRQLTRITKASAGFPAAINQLAQTLLFQQEMGDVDEQDQQSGLPLAHITVLVLLLVALILALLYMGGEESELENVSIDPLTLDINSAETASTELVSAEDNVGSESILSPASNVVAPDVLAPSVKTSSISEPIVQDSVATGPLSPSGNVGTWNVGTGTSKGKVEEKVGTGTQNAENAVTTNTANTGTGTSKAQTVAVPKQELSSPAPKTASKPVAKIDDVSQGTTKPVSAKPALTSPAPAKAVRLKEIKTAPKSSSVQSVASDLASPRGVLSPDESKVMAWPEDAFTIQVMAAGQKINLLRFIELQANRDQLLLVTTERAGKPWYVVVTKVYRDNKQARQAIQSLPQAQINAGPWVRTIADIKRQIKAAPSKP